MESAPKQPYESQEPTINDAFAYVQGVMSYVHSMGANDSEFSSLQHILQQLQLGAITPAGAMELAAGIRDSKQAYH